MLRGDLRASSTNFFMSAILLSINVIPPMRSVMYSFIHSLVRSGSFVRLLVCSLFLFVCSFDLLLVCYSWFVQWFVGLSVCWFVGLIVCTLFI